MVLTFQIISFSSFFFSFWEIKGLCSTQKIFCLCKQRQKEEFATHNTNIPSIIQVSWRPKVDQTELLVTPNLTFHCTVQQMFLSCRDGTKNTSHNKCLYWAKKKKWKAIFSIFTAFTCINPYLLDFPGSLCNWGAALSCNVFLHIWKPKLKRMNFTVRRRL